MGDGKQRTVTSWTISQKGAAIERVKEIGLKPTAKELKISITCLKRWRKQAQDLETMGEIADNRCRLPGGGRLSSFSQALADDLLSFFDGHPTMENGRLPFDMMISHVRSYDPSLNDVPRALLRRRICRVFRRNKIIAGEATHRAQITGHVETGQPDQKSDEQETAR